MTGCSILDFGTPARKNGKLLPCEALQAENEKLRMLVFYAIHVLEKNGLQSAAKVIESELGIEGDDA